MEKKNKPSKEISKKTQIQKKDKTPRKMTNKEKAKFSEQNRIDIYPIDIYNDKKREVYK